MKTVLVVFFITVCIMGTSYFQLKKEAVKVKEFAVLLTEKNKQLDEKLRVFNINMDVICQEGMQGSPRYIHCGDSFVPSYATCVCTTMCLEDYSVVMSNREKCKDWTYRPIKISPDEEDKDDDEETDDEDEER